jgi:hypothetical protein
MMEISNLKFENDEGFLVALLLGIRPSEHALCQVLSGLAASNGSETRRF